jgi:hypothetical protein
LEVARAVLVVADSEVEVVRAAAVDPVVVEAAGVVAEVVVAVAIMPTPTIVADPTMAATLALAIDTVSNNV